MSVGIWQLLLIFMAVLVLFGAGRIPRVMGDIGRGVKSLKEGLKEDEPTVSLKNVTPKSTDDDV